MEGVDSLVDLVEVVEDHHSTVEHNIDCKESNDEIRDRTEFHDLPDTTDKKPSLGTTIGADGILRLHRNNFTREL